MTITRSISDGVSISYKSPHSQPFPQGKPKWGLAICLIIVSDSSWFANLVYVIYVISFANSSLVFSAYRKWSADVREVILVVLRSLEFKPEPMCEYNDFNSFILFFIGTSLG